MVAGFAGVGGLGYIFGLLLTWALLATLYFFPVWLVAFYTDRDLNFRASWKVAGAALMPGALLLTLGIVLYGFRGVRPRATQLRLHDAHHHRLALPAHQPAVSQPRGAGR